MVAARRPVMELADARPVRPARPVAASRARALRVVANLVPPRVAASRATVRAVDLRLPPTAVIAAPPRDVAILRPVAAAPNAGAIRRAARVLPGHVTTHLPVDAGAIAVATTLVSGA